MIKILLSKHLAPEANGVERPGNVLPKCLLRHHVKKKGAETLANHIRRHENYGLDHRFKADQSAKTEGQDRNRD